jgi:Glycosyltransferase Family 4
MMRVLHVVKTADGAGWAADEAAELVRLGLELHVALPSLCGANVARWQRAGAVLHVAPTDVNLRAPWSMPAAARKLRDLVSSVRPDVIHSHFFSSTILLRVGLGSGSKIPRLFQVPGPLHMEHGLYRKIEISSATPSDRWIASSRCIFYHYLAAGVTRERLYLSYYGAPMERQSLATFALKIPHASSFVFIGAVRRWLLSRTLLSSRETAPTTFRSIAVIRTFCLRNVLPCSC